MANKPDFIYPNAIELYLYMEHIKWKNNSTDYHRKFLANMEIKYNYL